MLAPRASDGVVVVSQFLQLEGHAGSELAGVCFNPAGDRMYVSSQRGSRSYFGLFGIGVTFEISGPFNRAR